MNGPWSRALLDVLDANGHEHGEVTELRVEAGLVAARVDGRPVTLSAPTIPPGIWSAVEAQVAAGRQSEQLAQTLEHTWEEPLVPEEIVRVGRADDVAAVAVALAQAVESEPETLLRFRGHPAHAAAPDADAWRGRELPPLPPPARRPPESVPKRFGASGIVTPDGDLVEVLVRAYRTFGA